MFTDKAVKRYTLRHSYKEHGNIFALVLYVLAFFYCQSVFGQQIGHNTLPNTDTIPVFGGPSSVAAELRSGDGLTDPQYRSDNIQRELASWFEFKKKLNEKFYLNIAVDYQSLMQVASASLGDKLAASGVARLYGTWTLLNRDTNNAGALVIKGENRHRLGTDVAPQNFGFEVGAIAIPGSLFTDYNWGLTNLYWQQKLANSRAGFVLGQVDVTDYFDVYGMVNPLTAFSNLVFQTNPTIAAPNQGLGFAAAAYLSNNIYFSAGLADANGDPTNPNFDVFKKAETFKHVEMGWTSSPDRVYFDNIHISMWHVSERKEDEVPKDRGMTLSAAYFVGNHWLPFLRVGWSRGDAALLARSASAGIGYFRQNRDLFGFGINVGRPGDKTLKKQLTMEMFYRLQFSENFSVTADAQVITDPALNPDTQHIFFGGLRARLNI